MLHSQILNVTQRVIDRSRTTRKAYLDHIHQEKKKGISRQRLSCGNLAHGFAACSQGDKQSIQSLTKMNVGIISAYNDMLSAHQPYHRHFCTSRK